MSFRDELLDKLDMDRNGKVNLADAVKAAEDRFGVIQVTWGFGGFVAGVVAAVVVLKVVLGP